MSTDPEFQLLSGLLAGSVEFIDEVSHLIREEHFVDPTHKLLYRQILSYRSIARGVLPSTAVESAISGLDAGTAALVSETYDALFLLKTPTDVARFAVHSIRASYEKRLTQIALREASDILTGSFAEEPVSGRPARTWSGPGDAREWARARIGEIDAETAMAEAPAADVLLEGRSIIEDYLAAASEDRSRRPRFGIPALDETIDGLGKGLIMVAASSGLGKTQACVSLAYHAAQYQGLHVYFATSETVRQTVRARMVARHSRHEMFADMRAEFNAPKGLNSKQIDRGTLPPEHMPFFAQVAADWGVQGSPSSEGTCYVAQMPHGETMASLSAQIRARSRLVKPDLVIIDYIALMSPESRNYSSSREALASVIKEAQHFAIDFDGGRGVPTVSPWQLNRKGQEEMTKTGIADTLALAETSEAVNSAHLVLVLSPDGARDERSAGLKIHVLKNRDGEVLLGDQAVSVSVDYASSLFEQRAGGSFSADSESSLFADDSMSSLVPDGI